MREGIWREIGGRLDAHTCGMFFITPATISSGSSLVMSDSMKPGATALTVMPRDALSAGAGAGASDGRVREVELAKPSEAEPREAGAWRVR